MENQKTILIVGGSGFVGTHLILKLKESHKIFATYYHQQTRVPGVTFLALNVDDKKEVKRILYQIRPDVIIYVAGAPQENLSEANHVHSEKMHLTGLGAVLSSFDIMQPRFIFISNALVFDGSRGNYHENDTVLPRSGFGKIKLSAENTIKGKCLNYLILRSSLIFGRGNGGSLSLVDQLRMQLDQNKRFEVDHSEFHSFVWINCVCDVIDSLIHTAVRNRVFHYGGLTKITLFEFSIAFAKRFKYNSELIIPKAINNQSLHYSEEPFCDYSLNSTQTAEVLKVKTLLLEEGFDLFEKSLVSRC